MENNPEWCRYDRECLRCTITIDKCNDCKYKICTKKGARVLNPEIAEFVNELNKRLENK